MCACIKGKTVSITLSFAVFTHSGECSLRNGYLHSNVLSRIEIYALKTAKAHVSHRIFGIVLDIKLDNVLARYVTFVFGGDKGSVIPVLHRCAEDISIGKTEAERIKHVVFGIAVGAVLH